MSRPFKIRRWLVPAGWIFGKIVCLRRWLYVKGWLRTYRPNLPVICVGNIAIGGTGKTPHAEYLVALLDKNYHVAMLSRGYGRKTHGYILANALPKEALSAESIGDEPLLLHQRFPQLPLAVAADRKQGVVELCKYDPEIQVVVMDDAYQHLNFLPTLRLVLTEYHRPYFKDYPMPAGRLREFPQAAQQADAVIVTKTDAPNETLDRFYWREKLALREDQPLFFTKYQYGTPEPVTPLAKTENLADKSVVLLTGIARPQPLVDYIKRNFNLCKHIQYQDHHPYTLLEIEQLGRYLEHEKECSKVLFTTEKDWMRLQNRNLKKTVSLLPVFIVPIHVDFLTDTEKVVFDKLIENHVRRTKK